MEQSTVVKEGYVDGARLRSYSSPSLFSSSSHRDVTYSCGACGYELNLSSSNRNTSMIGSKYGKSIKRGIITFVDVDESRFTQVDEIQCSWRFFTRRTKLLCRKCGNHIGNARVDFASSVPLVSDGSDSSPRQKYQVKIRALQPSSSEESAFR